MAGIRTVGIVGAGVIGSGWAARALAHGLDVVAWDPGSDAEAKTRSAIANAWPALERACAGLGHEQTLLVVAHDAVNRVLLCKILGLPLARLWSFRQAPTTINLLEGPDVEHLDLVRLNDCQHHTPFFGEAVHRAM